MGIGLGGIGWPHRHHFSIAQPAHFNGGEQSVAVALLKEHIQLRQFGFRGLQVPVPHRPVRASQRLFQKVEIVHLPASILPYGQGFSRVLWEWEFIMPVYERGCAGESTLCALRRGVLVQTDSVSRGLTTITAHERVELGRDLKSRAIIFWVSVHAHHIFGDTVLYMAMSLISWNLIGRMAPDIRVGACFLSKDGP